jgi:hypothetical protein
MSDKATKHENFKRMANQRAGKIANSFRVLSNLASYNYEFEAKDVDSLFGYIEEQLAKARAKFDARLNKVATVRGRPKAAGGDLGEDATPCSPQTGLPGPTESDIEQDGPQSDDTEAPWSNDEPTAAREPELVTDGFGTVRYR